MIYYSDGFTIDSNPGSKGGYTITDSSGKLLKTTIIKKNGFTNNEAELLGVYNCVKTFCVNGDTVITDSMNNIYWCKSGFSKTRLDLNGVISKCKKLIKKKNINLVWEGRDGNLAGQYNEGHYSEPKPKYYTSY